MIAIRNVAGIPVVAIVMFAAFSAAYAADPPQTAPVAPSASMAAGMKMMPQTAEEHSAMAESYKQKAANYRQDAEMHRQMLAEYKKGAVHLKQGENPWVTKMRLHCEKYIVDADRLVADADEFAQFHTMRAKELRGQ
jgi:hypothetical protein